jgi:hypothetical protein
MPKLQRGLAVIVLLGAAAPAVAQLPRLPAVIPVQVADPVAVREAGLPSFFTLPPMPNQPAGARRGGLIAAMPLGDGLTIGVGRFRALELARPRTHVEADRRPTDIRPRDRGIAAVGLSLRF